MIGCGHIGKRHATLIQQNPEAELVALCDVLPEESLGIEAFNVPFFHDLDTVLASGIDMDVLAICTPNGLHAQQAIKALEKRLHVVCEKPMGLHKAECEAVIFKALQMSRNVFCVMQNRYSPPAVWLKALLQENRLGNIYMVQTNCYWNRDEHYYQNSTWKGKKLLDGGTLFTQFSHFVDMLYWLFGDIKNIQARLQNFSHQNQIEFEDSGIVSFDFINGGSGSINYSTSVWDKNMESSMTIIGEKGSIKVGGQYMDKVEYCHVENYELPELTPSNPPNDYGFYKGSAANHNYIIQNVIDTLKGRTEVTTNALEGMKVVEIIERIYNAAAVS